MQLATATMHLNESRSRSLIYTLSHICLGWLWDFQIEDGDCVLKYGGPKAVTALFCDFL